jgi:NAD-dependent SIR2 family protein deacetylase
VDIKDEMRQMGYSKEDEYFYKQTQDLIGNLREAANERKKEREEKHKGHAYWMTCPKCGARLKEQVLEKVVRIDVCAKCGGQFFDQGELDLLLKSRIASTLRTGG